MTTLQERTGSTLSRETVEALARFSQWAQPLESRKQTHHVVAHHIQQETPIHPVVESKLPLEIRWESLREVTFEKLKTLVRNGHHLRFTYASDEVKLCFTISQSRVLQSNGIHIIDVRDITVSSGNKVTWQQDKDCPFETTLTGLAINSDLISYLWDYTT